MEWPDFQIADGGREGGMIRPLRGWMLGGCHLSSEHLPRDFTLNSSHPLVALFQHPTIASAISLIFIRYDKGRRFKSCSIVRLFHRCIMEHRWRNECLAHSLFATDLCGKKKVGGMKPIRCIREAHTTSITWKFHASMIIVAKMGTGAAKPCGESKHTSSKTSVTTLHLSLNFVLSFRSFCLAALSILSVSAFSPTAHRALRFMPELDAANQPTLLPTRIIAASRKKPPSLTDFLLICNHLHGVIWGAPSALCPSRNHDPGPRTWTENEVWHNSRSNRCIYKPTPCFQPRLWAFLQISRIILPQVSKPQRDS